MTHHGKQKAEFQLVLALAGGVNVRDAAARAGVSERTAYRRLDDPDFRNQIAQARGEMLGRAVGQLADAATDAVATLRALLAGTSESVRLGAARAILEVGNRLRETVELEQRLLELEQRAHATQDSCRPS